jgi:hypothetical protein
MSEDHEARTQAALAHQRLDSHEERCGERWKETKRSIDLLHRRISKGQSSVIWWIIGAQGTALLVVTGVLVKLLK